MNPGALGATGRGNMNTPSRLTADYEGNVLVLRIDGAATRNSLGPQIFTEALSRLEEAQLDCQVGAVVVTGAHGFFSSGGNLAALGALGTADDHSRHTRIELLHRLITAIRRCSKPVIMAVEGGAAGAGMSLALSGDLLLASHDAFFSAAYIKAGLTPDGGLTALLGSAVPRQLLTQWCLTGERIPAGRLHELGAVNELLESGTVLRRAIELGQQLAAGPPQATARILELVDTAGQLPFDEQLERELRCMTQSLAGVEAAESLAAIRERRKPHFGPRGG